MNHPCSQIAGNQTIERLQHIFASFNQAYGGLTLDLHCNRFGPTALFQVLVIPWGLKWKSSNQLYLALQHVLFLKVQL
jgi:hypothetical protein